MSDSLWPHGLQHTRLPRPSPMPGACSDLHPSSQWCHLPISSSVFPFSSCIQSFPASASFPVRQFFTSDGQSIGVSTSASDLPMNIQDWFPLGWTALILQSKELSRVFSSTAVQKRQSSTLRFLLAFSLLHFVLQGKTFLLLQVSLDFLLLHSSLLWWKGHLFGVSSRWSYRSS